MSRVTSRESKAVEDYVRMTNANEAYAARKLDTCSVRLSRNSRVLSEALAWTSCSRARYCIVSSIPGAHHKSRSTILGANGASKNCGDVRATIVVSCSEKSLLRTHQRSLGVIRENDDSNCANYVPLCDRHEVINIPVIMYCVYSRVAKDASINENTERPATPIETRASFSLPFLLASARENNRE